jgi:hypothetical protein
MAGVLFCYIAEWIQKEKMDTRLTIVAFAQGTKIFELTREQYGNKLLDQLIRRCKNIDELALTAEVGSDIWLKLAELKELNASYVLFTVYERYFFVAIFGLGVAAVGRFPIEATVRGWKSGTPIDDTAHRLISFDELSEKEQAAFWTLVENSVTLVFYGSELQ